MADYNIKAEITADASGFESGVKKAEKASKNLSKSVSGVIQGLGKNGLVGALGAVGLASSGLSATLGSVVKIARQVSATMSELTNAYKTQLIAERQLDTAIQNNPFVTGASADALKQFASEMQKVSNYGDEELIPMMANLVSLGRTESETMKIMSVAMDMSAGMGISLDSAITQLNATLNGNIGRLGQQNAELKDLTEEELKQGKAVEILGEKFKGLSGATADTSKQLQNIKGDFKEALGQFTLPSSDMWNRFWAGFYERGIEVIGKINAYIDAQTIGKKTSNFLVEQLAPLEYYGDRIKYLRDSMHLLADDELQALGNYLSGLKNTTEEQKQILNFVEQEKLRRKDLQTIEKTNAELKKAKADAEAQATAELQKQEEVAKKKTDWGSKLLDQRIEMLETERDRAMQLAEEEGKETYTIWIDYNNKILELKLEKLEKEKEKALAEEGLTAEDKIKIEEYYSGETKKIYNDLGNYKKKKNAEEKKDEKNKFAIMIEYAKQYAEKIKSVVSKVISTIKSVISGGVSLFQKLFEIKPDEILNNILKVEDSILTFFVETLPQMPSLIESIMQSISVLVGNIRSVVKAEDIRKIVRAITKTITDNLPQIISDILIILEEVIDGLIDGLIDWLDSDEGLEKLLKLILQIQKSVEKIVSKALTKLIDMLDDNKDVFSKFLADSMASANRTLPVLLKAIVQLITILIETIAGAFSDSNFVNSIVESIEKSIKAIIPMIPRFINAIIQLVVNIISALVPYLPQIIMSIVTAISDALPSMAGQIAGSLSKGIAKIFKSIFTPSFWNDVFSSMGSVVLEIIKASFSALDVTSILGLGSSSSSSTSGSTATFDPADIFDPLGVRHLFGFANGSNSVPRGLAMVGEAGPELIRFRGGEQVLNNRNTNKALAEMGKGGNSFNVVFNNTKDTTAFTMIQQLKQYNRQMAINGVI